MPDLATANIRVARAKKLAGRKMITQANSIPVLSFCPINLRPRAGKELPVFVLLA
jgi:hypothetical protein